MANVPEQGGEDLGVLAAAFWRLFLGNERHHGTHGALPLGSSGGPKVKPPCSTVPGPATPELWREHLAGTKALGVVPIRDDATCCWAAVDVDDYSGLDHKALAQRIEALGLPLVVCRSKSGGAHLFAFFHEPMAAAGAQRLLGGFARSLDLKKVEIFPKQDRLEPGGQGNWLNMPYFKPGSTRYALTATGALEAPGFLELAEQVKITAAQVDDWLSQPIPETQWEPETPPSEGEEPAPETTTEEGAAYAARMLERYVTEIRDAVEGQRNTLINKCTFNLGRMAARGWIAPEDIRDAILAAAEACGAMEGDERKTTLRTMKGAFKRGFAKPHPDLRGAPKSRSAPDAMIAFGRELEVFHSADGTAFVDVQINGHRETWAVRSREFESWLTRRYYQETAKAPTEGALKTAISAIAARARFDGREGEAYLRTASLNGSIFLDLCNPTWQAVQIDAHGWRVIDTPPVRFRRTAGMQALPVPVTGGSIAALRSCLNVQTEDDFALTVGWLLAALRPSGPYPVLAVSGAEGSAKTTFCKTLRALVDPNTVSLRAPPKDIRSLFVAAKNNHVMGYDNFSYLPDWMSDTLCRLATGGGHAERTNYTDESETLFSAERPIILNGIPEVVTRPDLASRTISVTLEPIAKARRRPEEDVRTSVGALVPGVLGALLDAVSHGLRMLPVTRLDELPRMADFAKWVVACEGALPWAKGTFIQAYNENTEATTDIVSEGDDVTQAICSWMSSLPSKSVNGQRFREWTGTATELLRELNEQGGERNMKTWPTSPRGLRARLSRSQRVLQDRHRITIERSRQAHQGRLFTITEHDVRTEDSYVPF